MVSEGNPNPQSNAVLIVDEGIQIEDGLVGVGERSSDRAITTIISVQGDDCRSAEVVGEQLRTFDRGKPSHGESENEVVAERLRERLNEGTQAWGPHEDGDGEPVDWMYHSVEGSILKCQGVRVPCDQSYWRARKQAAVDERTIARAIEDIRASIQKKERKKYDPVERAQLVLVLDATRSGAHSLPDVVNRFVELHGAWASSLGFEAIWIVGLNSRVTSRLA